MTTSKNNRFNITPRPRMLLGVQNQNWNASGALAEMIDNSFGPGRGNASIVKIIYDSAKHTLTMLDNGVGMGYLGQLFQLGNTVGYTAGDIGHYGSGGTQAIIWLPEWVQVATCREPGTIMHDRITWSEVFDLDSFEKVTVSNSWVAGNFAQFSEYPTGTAILMKLLTARAINESRLIRDLSRLFAPGIRNKKKIIWVHQKNGKVVESTVLSDPFELEAAPEDTVKFNIVLEYAGRRGKKLHLPVKGMVQFNQETSHQDSKIRVGYGYREIMRTREFYRKGKKSYSGNGVSGWLDLGEGWNEFLTLTKDGISNDELKSVLGAHVFSEIELLLKKSEDRVIDVELNNIAINLQFALQSALKSSVKVKPGKEIGGGQQGGEGEGGDDDGDKPRHERDPDGKEKKVPGSTHIRLIKQTNDQMKGVLARADTDAIGMLVEINKEHDFVTEALKAKPTNRAALNLMIVQELATVLIENPEIMKRALKTELLKELDTVDNGDKARKIVRHLIDSVPAKPLSSEAAE